MTRFSLPLLAAFAVIGCSTKPPPSQTETGGEAAVTSDPWATAATTLRKQPDLGGARQVIAQLTADLANNPKAEAPPALAPDAAQALGKTLRLSPEDFKEITSATYTNLDAAYVAECLLIRDAVRSLDLGNHTDERKAAYGFAWVCRQMYLRPGTIRVSPDTLAFTPSVSPQFALLRGYGSGLERAYTFLAVLQQLGLDGCLVGPPDREQAPSLAIEGDKPAKGPFWAVGARLPDGAVLLFDPWRGQPFPGTGDGVGTLAQVQANPALLKPWLEDKARPWDVSAADLKAATIYTAFRTSAVTPRIEMLEQKVSAEVGVKLSQDVTETLARWGSAAKVWAPTDAQDHHAYTRVLPSFLPIEEGGTDTTPANERRLYDQISKASRIPVEMFTPPPELKADDVQQALRNYFVGKFTELIASVNAPDKIHRGQFNEVIRTLIEREQRLDTFRQRARTSNLPPDALAQWAQRANELHQDLSLARLPQNQAALPDAQAAVEQFWNQGGPVLQHMEVTLIVPICQAELSYWIAVCKHEQAERAGIRFRRAPAADKGRVAAEQTAKDAWAVAKDSWDRYLTAGAAYLKVYPERTAHVRQLAERAGQLAANPAAAW